MWIKVYHPKQNTVVRQLIFLACSAFNLLSVYLVLYLAGRLSEAEYIAEQGVVMVTFLLTGIQVGQTVGVQTYISKTPSPVLALVLSLLLLMVASQLQIDDMLKSFVLTSIGAVCGYFLSYKVAFNLTSQDKWKFQALTSIRYIAIGASIILLILNRLLSATTLIATVVVATTLLTATNRPKERSISVTPKKMYVGLLTIFSGILLSLIYRNDVNIVRSLYSGMEEFASIHNMLIAFSVVVAGSGFIVTNYVYTKINDRAGAPLLFNKTVFSVAYSLLLVICVVALSILSPYLKTAACAIVASACPVFSAFLHLKAKSSIVYAIGGCSLLMIMFVIRQALDMSPLNAFLLYNLTTLSLLYVVSVYCMSSAKK